MQDLPLFSNCRLRFISGASLLSEAGLQLLLLGFQSLSAGFQSLLLFTPAAMGFGKNLNGLLQRRFLAFDRLLLIAENYGGGPVGVETISAALSESRDAIEEVIEPYLLQQGLIQRTPRGRVMTATAWKHLGLTPPKDADLTQFRLFDEGE